MQYYESKPGCNDKTFIDLSPTLQEAGALLNTGRQGHSLDKIDQTLKFTGAAQEDKSPTKHK